MTHQRIEPGHYAKTERDYHFQQARWWSGRRRTQPPWDTSDLARREAIYHARQGAHWELVRRFCIQHERRQHDGPKRES